MCQIERTIEGILDDWNTGREHKKKQKSIQHNIGNSVYTAILVTVPFLSLVSKQRERKYAAISQLQRVTQFNSIQSKNT
jgi:hypothetical protein